MFSEMEDPAERFVWFGFLLLAGDSAYEGKISLTENIGYTDEQLGSLLKCDIQTIKNAKVKMLKYDKIEVFANNVIQIVNWKKYQSEYQRQKPYRGDEKLQEKVTPKSDKQIEKEIEIRKRKEKEKKNKEQVAEIIKYFNEKTGKNFRIDPKNSINARLNDGFTVEDCKKVIDIKTATWLNDSKMNTFLRLETLFRPTKFESYLNEKIPGEIKSLTPQEEKEKQLEKEYGKN